MRICIFYKDIFDKGGLPGELRALANAFTEKTDISLIGKQKEQKFSDNLKIENCYQYSNNYNLFKVISLVLEKFRPNLVMIVGFFIPENIIALKMAKKRNIKTILYPTSNIMDAVFNTKIFTIDPDVRKLEQKYSRKIGIVSKINIFINPFLKYIYKITFGKIILNMSDIIAVLSDFEKTNILNHFPSQKNFIYLKWGINNIIGINDSNHFYREVLKLNDNRLNYVYWGRIDWYFKGLDRLFNGINKIVTEHIENVPFRIFLIGPDYRSGIQKAEAAIRRNHLEDVVHIIKPGGYKAGSKAPLRDADCSIYLSRWDGFPRTLRESIFLNIPVLVSEETHFKEIVKKYNCGITLTNADDQIEVADALKALSNNKKRFEYSQNTEYAKDEISYSEIVNGFMTQIKELI